MSQVIVEEDKLKEKRLRSAQEEHLIQRETEHQKWLATNTFGLSAIAKGAAVVFLPVALFWAALSFLMTAILRILATVFRFIGVFFGGTKSST